MSHTPAADHTGTAAARLPRPSGPPAVAICAIVTPLTTAGRPSTTANSVIQTHMPTTRTRCACARSSSETNRSSANIPIHGIAPTLKALTAPASAIDSGTTRRSPPSDGGYRTSSAAARMMSATPPSSLMPDVIAYEKRIVGCAATPAATARSRGSAIAGLSRTYSASPSTAPSPAMNGCQAQMTSMPAARDNAPSAA